MFIVNVLYSNILKKSSFETYNPHVYERTNLQFCYKYANISITVGHVEVSDVSNNIQNGVIQRKSARVYCKTVLQVK